MSTSVRMGGEVIRWIDKMVKDRAFSSRIHAFECALRRLMKREAIQRS